MLSLIFISPCPAFSWSGTRTIPSFQMTIAAVPYFPVPWPLAQVSLSLLHAWRCPNSLLICVSATSLDLFNLCHQPLWDEPSFPLPFFDFLMIKTNICKALHKVFSCTLSSIHSTNIFVLIISKCLTG